MSDRAVHVVKKGDTLYHIAHRVEGCTLTVQGLIDQNKDRYPTIGTGSNSLIMPGWVLYITDGSDATPDPVTGAPLEVKHHTDMNAAGTANSNLDVYNECDMKEKKSYKITKGTSVQVTISCSDNGLYHVIKNGDSSICGWVNQAGIDFINVEISKEEAEQHARDMDDITSRLRNLSSNQSLTANNNLLIENANGIHGMPYQFMESVDSRIPGTCFGRKYAEKIVSKMPLLLLTPGLPDFVPDFSDDDKNNILQAMVGLVNGNNVINENLKNLLSGENQRYYTFDFAYSSYYTYVNLMLRYCAVALGIDKVYHGNESYSEQLGSFDWSRAVNSNLKGFFSSSESIAFYVDSETSVSESFSTSTTQSQLVSSFNSASEISRELQFLAGPIAGIKVESLSSESSDDAFTAAIDGIKGIANNIFGSSKLFNNLEQGFKTIGKGGKLIFPEIWDDTDFSRSYSFNIKLRTPDADKISWYLNILVPLIHLICLAAPRSMGPNGYKSPYLVRGYYKGIFNCDMGIITSMDITKGREAAWSVDGLPTEVDVSVTLKDLYNMLSISNNENGFTSDKGLFTFFRNTCLIDYLSNMCGININEPEVARITQTYALWAKNRISDTFTDAWRGFNESISNALANAYGKFIFK